MMVTIIIMIKLFHLFISALCAAVFLDSVNLTETYPVSLSLFTLRLHRLLSQQVNCTKTFKASITPDVIGGRRCSVG